MTFYDFISNGYPVLPVVNLQEIKNNIITMLGRGSGRMAPALLQKAVSESYGKVQRQLFFSAVKELIRDGLLVYTHRFSSTQLEINYQRRIAISDRIVLSPGENNQQMPSGSVAAIKISSGASFGMGDHPTTRLALKAIDVVSKKITSIRRDQKSMALDIGTGSGVLAIAAANLGIDMAMGIDVDPVARYEACHNVALNGLEDKVQITGDSPESLLPRKFDLIAANLRPPTLRDLFPIMKKISSRGAFWVLSGFRENEKKVLVELIEKISGRLFCQKEEMGWSCIVVNFQEQV